MCDLVLDGTCGGAEAKGNPLIGEALEPMQEEHLSASRRQGTDGLLDERQLLPSGKDAVGRWLSRIHLPIRQQPLLAGVRRPRLPPVVCNDASGDAEQQCAYLTGITDRVVTEHPQESLLHRIVSAIGRAEPSAHVSMKVGSQALQPAGERGLARWQCFGGTRGGAGGLEYLVLGEHAGLFIIKGVVTVKQRFPPIRRGRGFIQGSISHHRWSLDAAAGVKQPLLANVAAHAGFRVIDGSFTTIREAVGTRWVERLPGTGCTAWSRS